jgi:thioredoxin reductase
VAELTDRPSPPGRYRVIVIGSGPGGLQVASRLRRHGIRHAVLTADEAPGGMFRRWPFFQRLLSWTKPYAPVSRTARAYERYDWNSLLGEEPASRTLMPDLMDGSSYFPSRPEMEQNLELFAERSELMIRYGCRWTATRREETAAGTEFVLDTTDGEYRAEVVIFAVGVAEPFRPQTPGIELAAHYAETRAAESYADRRIFIIGKQNSGFELASGLLPWARRIILASPSPTKLSVNTHSLVGIRARYVQPFEDHVLGGGVSVLDAAIQSISRSADGALDVRVRPTAGGEELLLEVDEAIAATGFVTPLGDLPDLGVATFGQARLPAQTPYWESASVPGVYFAGTISQGAGGLKKHGLPANSGAVHGARYNARVLVDHLATTRFGVELERPAIAATDLVDVIVDELASAPELWHQRAYLARIISVDPTRGARNEGIVPLAAFVDSGTDGPTGGTDDGRPVGTDGSADAVALTIEADGSGAIYPVVYVRRSGAIKDHVIEPDVLLRYDTDGVRRQVAEILAGFGLAAGSSASR